MSRDDLMGMFWEDVVEVRGSKEKPARAMPAIPDTGWEPPADFPNLFHEKVIGLDTETNDPMLKTHGPGWGRDAGEVCGISLATEDGHSWYFPIRHQIQKEMNMDPEKVFRYLADLLGRPSAKVGANLLYDVGWLDHEGVAVKGKLYDVQYAEAILFDTAKSYSLEAVANRWLGQGKEDELLYAWSAKAYGGKAIRSAQAGNIHRCPPAIVGPYAEQDAHLPIEILKKQWKMLEKDNLLNIFELECALIPVLLGMRLRGMPVDLEKAEDARIYLQEKEDIAQSKLDQEAGFSVRVYTSGDLSRLFDKKKLKYPRTALGAPSFTKGWLAAHEHPIALQINEVRKYNKARTAFIENAIIDKEVNGKIHPSLHPLRGENGGAVSGRFSSSNPNGQQFPARDPELGPLTRGIFIPEVNFPSWIKQDLCLVGETKIKTTRGDIAISDLVPGKDKVLAINLGEPEEKQQGSELRSVLDKQYKLVQAAKETGIHEVYRIIFEDGSIVDATAEHKWQAYLPQKKYAANWIRTKELVSGSRLAHVHDVIAGGYIYHTFKGAKKRAICILEAEIGKRPKGKPTWHSDHINFNREDDTIANLRWLPAKENLSQGGTNYWKEIKANTRNDNKRLIGLREGLMKRRSYIGKENPNYGKKRPGVGGRPFLGSIENCPQCGEEYKKKRVSGNKYCSRKCYNNARRKTPQIKCLACAISFTKRYPVQKYCDICLPDNKNHRVVSITPIGKKKVYQISVKDWHNYVLANGLISSNSQIEYRCFAHFSGDQKLISSYQHRDVDYHNMVSEFLGNMMPRKIVKNFNFGSLYGMGKGKTTKMLSAEFTKEQVEELLLNLCGQIPPGNLFTQLANIFLSLYDTNFPAASASLKRDLAIADKHGEIRTILGRRSTFELWEPINKRNSKALNRKDALDKYGLGIKRAFCFRALNRRLQGSSADLLKKGMLDAHNEGIFDRIGYPHITVHDELDNSYHPDLREDFYRLQQIIEKAIPLSVPIIMDAEIGKDWGHVKAIKLKPGE